MYFGGSKLEPVRLRTKMRTMSTAKKIHAVFIYLLRRKKTAVVLRRELKHLGRCAHTQTLSPARITDHRGINGRDGAHVCVGRYTHKRRVDTVGEAIVLPPGPRAIDWGRDVACWTLSP